MTRESSVCSISLNMSVKDQNQPQKQRVSKTRKLKSDRTSAHYPKNQNMYLKGKENVANHNFDSHQQIIQPTRNVKELSEHLYNDFFTRNQKKEALIDCKAKDLKSKSQSKSI